MCQTYEGSVHRLDYKTLRYTGHFDQMHFLFDELNLRDQPELVGKMLVDSKPPVSDDIVYIHAAVEGVKAGQPFRENYVRGYKPLDISGRIWRAISWTNRSRPPWEKSHTTCSRRILSLMSGPRLSRSRRRSAARSSSSSCCKRPRSCRSSARRSS